jgi:ferredoxin
MITTDVLSLRLRLALNAEYARKWPNISSKGAAPEDAAAWSGAPDRFEKHFSPAPPSGT